MVKNERNCVFEMKMNGKMCNELKQKRIRRKPLPMDDVFEFFLEFALLTPDRIAFAWSRPKTRNVRESFKFFIIRYERERGTFDNIKCFLSAAFGESFPMAKTRDL